jgi:hypothetical protein
VEGLDKKTVVESSRSVGESNPSGLDARQGGISRYSAAGESKAVHPQSLVLVERHALEAVRQSQAELTRYVRAYFNSQERITACAELYESLLEGKKQPETWRSSDYLRRIEGSLRRIRPYARFLSGQGLEDEFSEQSNVFDSALADLMDIVAGDMSTVPQKVIKAAPAKAASMRRAAYDLATECEERAGEVIEAIRERLDEIFVIIRHDPKRSALATQIAAEPEVSQPTEATQEVQGLAGANELGAAKGAQETDDKVTRDTVTQPRSNTSLDATFKRRSGSGR